MSLTNALSRIDTFLSQNYPTQFAEWGDGLSEEKINDLVKDLPFVFPEELRELYKWHNGSGDHWICVVFPFSSLEDAIKDYKIISTFPNSWKVNSFPLFSYEDDILFVDCGKNDLPVWYMYWENGSTEIFWSSITKMILTIAEAFEMGAYGSDNDYYESDKRKLLKVMWRNDPDIINSLIEQLKIVKQERLHHIPYGYESIQRFVWQDIDKLLTSDQTKVDMLQEFTSIFLDECDRIINTP
ncbi:MULTISPECIES: SMI1/KNR4 family protein [Pseudanabaena]|uniref:Cell wall assembly/cell proliferation coordinating protein, KNR4 n=2 Tax=Pseudanabaena TaxID=1152 RepID=L8N0M3_9CYAN|nr:MULTISPECIES: SMI1/KNR4 family protein [Pseudanabaena]ELS32634.1 Cell wall assembly/cell proliferation coordinating protein, KNR4 [Pseudanabaena biceps PCC 7429]MDG3495126.1 SMI1/KNR4 family protein [Pseudanabaena catenata USMAC16]